MSEKPRFDLWLKHVCLFKHRNEASEAINGGKVKLNGKSAKAAATVKVGDTVEFTRGDWARKFVITEVPAKQLSKETAATAYRDESGSRPEKRDLIDQIFMPQRDRGAGRPTKRDRRDLEREGFGTRS